MAARHNLVVILNPERDAVVQASGARADRAQLLKALGNLIADQAEN